MPIRQPLTTPVGLTTATAIATLLATPLATPHLKQARNNWWASWTSRIEGWSLFVWLYICFFVWLYVCMFVCLVVCINPCLFVWLYVLMLVCLVVCFFCLFAWFFWGFYFRFVVILFGLPILSRAKSVKAWKIGSWPFTDNFMNQILFPYSNDRIYSVSDSKSFKSNKINNK